jgi:hypothetical protein
MILQLLVLVRATNWSIRSTCLPHFDGAVPGPRFGALAQPHTHVGDVRTPRSRTAGFNSSLGARGTSALIILHAALGSDERARPAGDATSSVAKAAFVMPVPSAMAGAESST